MYKRIFCFALALLMLCVVFTLSVSAYDPADPELALENKCKAELEEEYGIADISAEGDYISFAVKFENYTVFQWRVKNPMPTFHFNYLDGYWFDKGEIFGNYTLDNYGNVERLEETVNKGFICLNEIYHELPEMADMHLRGDVDGDKALTVKDATLVQKFVARYPDVVKDLVNDPVRIAVADMDSSGGFDDPDWVNNRREVTVKDATYIQKKVAKIIVDKDYQGFGNECIVVTVEEKNAPDFTLEDFPECDLSRIERRDYNFIEMTIFELYLTNPSKENVIDAVNSLKYREGTDFDEVSPNYLDYSD